MTRTLVCLMVLLMGTLPMFAEAQLRQRGTSEAVGWELAPFAGMRFGGNFSVATDAELANQAERDIDVDDAPAYGLVLEFPSGHQTQWQIMYSHQGTEVDLDEAGLPGTTADLDIDTLHFGGTFVLDGDRGRPYLGFGVGLSHFRPDGSDFDDETEFSFGFMGGYKYRISEHFGIRIDLRALGTVVDSDSRIFCSGGCVVRWESDVFWQFDTTVGLNFYF